MGLGLRELGGSRWGEGGVVTCPVLVYVANTRPVLFHVGDFGYMPRSGLCGEFLLHAPCYIMWGVILTLPCSFTWEVSHRPLAYVERQLTNHYMNNVG